MKANQTQVAGDHYRSTIQHWDYVVANDLDYFQAQITKYVSRWKKKNGIIDLKKAQHFLVKYLEVIDSNPELYGLAHKVGKPAAPGVCATPLTPPPAIDVSNDDSEAASDQPTASQLHPG